MSFSYVENTNTARIKVIGVGGAGGNAVNNMITKKLKGVKFIAANTDAQALEASKAEVKIQIGKKLTQGLGAGSDPNKGKEAALENLDELKDALEGSHMVFITAGFGGGTGTGAAPVIAEICKNLEVLTVAVVSKPFSFEGKKKEEQALEGLKRLHAMTDTVITIPNDRLRQYISEDLKVIDMYTKVDEILQHSVKSITDLIMVPGYVNLDFADVKAIMQKSGKALMGVGIASGENRAVEAAENAVTHSLLEDVSVKGAKGVLLNITASSDLTIAEMTKASDKIHEDVGDNAEIIWGQTFDDDLGDEMRVTVIATGIGIENDKVSNNAHDLEDIDPALQAAAQPVNNHQAAAVLKPVENSQIQSANNRVRNPTKEELENWDDPAKLVVSRNKKADTDDSLDDHKPIPLNIEDLERPTFLRRKVD